MADRLARMREICKAATPGPWAHEDNCEIITTVEQDGCFVPFPPVAITADENNIGTDQAGLNADFIAAFHPSSVLALIELVEEATKIIIQHKEHCAYGFDSDEWLSKLSEFQNEGVGDA